VAIKHRVQIDPDGRQTALDNKEWSKKQGIEWAQVHPIGTIILEIEDDGGVAIRSVFNQEVCRATWHYQGVSPTSAQALSLRAILIAYLPG